MHLSRRHHECCAGFARGAFALPGTSRKYERAVPFQFHHLSLELQVDVAGRSIEGTATWKLERKAQAARTLVLDAVAFELQAVELDQGRGFAPVSYEYDGLSLKLEIPRKAQHCLLRVKYFARPERGLYFLAPDEHTKDRPLQVWSQCQDEDARHWVPCHDKPHVKSSAEFKIRVAKQFQVLCNGALQTARNSGQFRHYHYLMEQALPSYLFTLVAGNFEEVVDRSAKLASGREIPVKYLVPLGKKADGVRAFSRTPEMIELFSKLTGVEYPYASYTQVVVSDFIFGGMENTTATTMYEHILLDERAAIDIESHDLVAHELAHQWFGDLVTCRDWPHAWLNEGFATYFECLEREARVGADDYIWAVERDLASYLSEASGRYSRAVVAREYDEPIDLFDRHLYEKGGIILHLLRTELGAPAFWQGINQYLLAHAHGNSVTVDLQNALERASSLSLDRFFDQWLLRPGHPSLKVRASYESGRVAVRFDQTQAELFELSYEVIVCDAAGKLHTLQATTSDKHFELSLELKARPAYIGVDPNLRLLGSVQLETSFDWAVQQLKRSTSARLRRQAATWLGTRHDFRAVGVLSTSLTSKQEHNTVRVACAASLGRLRSSEAFDALRSAARATEPRVRAAVADALGEFRSSAALDALKAMLKGEKSYLVEAAVTRGLGAVRQDNIFPLLAKQSQQTSWADVVATAALDAVAQSGTSQALPVILEAAKPTSTLRKRRAAAAALGKLGDVGSARRHLVELLDDPNPLLRTDVVIALYNMGGDQARAALRSRLGRETDGRVTRRIREVLLKADSGDDQRQVRERLLRMEREVEEVKSQLASLKAKHKA